MFDFVLNGKISSKNSIFAAGIEGATAKCIITKGDKSRPGKKGWSPLRSTVRAIKAQTRAQPEKKGRDASGASSGAEALIASSLSLKL